MPVIELGDEIEDITAKVRGIVIARIEYLNGEKGWIIQPPFNEGERIPSVEVQEAYAIKVGDGVRVKRKSPMGFHVKET